MLQGRAFLVDNNDHVQIGELVATYGPDRRRFDVSVRRIEVTAGPHKGKKGLMVGIGYN
jgi:hypothetical protein